MAIKMRLIARAGAVVFGAAVLVLPQSATASAAHASPACQPTRLPVPVDVVASQVNGGDHSGRYLAGQGYIPGPDGTYGTYVALMWVNGRLRVLDTSAVQPHTYIGASDVNSHGVVVGSRWTDNSTFHSDAWVYRAGRATLLPPLHPGDETRAAAINARGDIVGTSAGDWGGAYHEWAVVWPADRPGTVRELVLAGEASTLVAGVDIDDDGTILGLVGSRPSDGLHPYVWPPHGSGYALAGPEPGYSEARAVHNGQVVGTSTHWDGDLGTMVATKWDLSNRAAEIVSTNSYTAIAVSRQGVIATVTGLVYPDGRELALDGYLRVLSDRRTAAGADAEFAPNNAVMWTHC